MLSHDHVTTPFEVPSRLDSSLLNLPLDLSHLEDLDFGYDGDAFWDSARSESAAGHWMPTHAATTQYTPDFYSFSHQQQQQQQHPNGREWQSGYSDVFSPYSVSHTSPQHRQHRRALSNSTVTSQASGSPQTLPIAHGAAGALDGAQYRHLHNAYYPTPSHTPTQDSFMDRNPRRRQDASKTYPTTMRSATSQFSQYGDFPATPSTVNGDERMAQNYAPIIPRLEPTMTQACADELYAPSVGAPMSYTVDQNMLHPSGRLQERVNAANAARSHSPDIKRDASPFREGSRFATEDSRVVQTAAQQRQQQKWVDDQEQQWRHQTRGEDPHQEPKTISPKDAYVDNFHHPAEDVTGPPLFPSQPMFDDSYRFARYPPTTSFSFQAPSTPAIVHPVADYKFATLDRQGSGSSDTPALLSMETSRSDHSSTSTPSLPQSRAPRALAHADSGTYSCTYAGCPQRFATPALLQKHKRDYHRSTAGSRHTTASPRPGEAVKAVTSAPTSAPDDRNSQAGPHRCDQINPSTGKSCNTVFSRPYDLTRHEDTIHARRPKVSCQYCAENGEEKTFSRADALTRHLRVVHPDIEAYGKAGRRRN